MVESTTRQEFEEGQDPRSLPKPKPLRGVVRRPLPIGRLTREMKTGLGATFLDLGGAVDKDLEQSGILADIERDALAWREREGKGKGPVGQGGRLLSEEREKELRRLFRRVELRRLGDIIRPAVDDWEIAGSGTVYESHIRNYNAGGRAGQKRLGATGRPQPGVRIVPSFDLRNPFILDSLKSRANLLTGGIAQDTFDRIRTVIADSFYIKGNNPLQTARLLKKDFSWMSRTRSELVARTETLAVTGEAEHTLYTASGVPFKKWLTTLDGLERETHFEAHGQIQAIDDYYQVGDSELLFPGDPGGDIEELANCRCSEIPVVRAGQFTGQPVWDGNVAPDEFAAGLPRAA